MPYRRLPKTDRARLQALRILVEQDDDLQISGRLVEWNLMSKLGKCYSVFVDAHKNYTEALKKQLVDSEKNQEAAKMARMYLSHFIQVLNMTVQRGEIKREYLKMYQLQDLDYTVPDLSTDSLILKWGETVINGEKERTTKGGLPIYNPTIAKVSVRYDIFKELYLQQKHLQESTSAALQNVAALREATDELLLQVWNEIEGHFLSLDWDKRIEECSRYGMIYYYRRKERQERAKKDIDK